MIRTILRTQIKRGFIVNPLPAENQNLYVAVADGVNYYAITTNFYRNALWGQYPSVEADDGLLLAFEGASVQRSINGTGVITASEGRYEASETRYHLGIRDPETGLLEGHVIFYPYSSNDQNIPDRVRSVIWMIGTSNIVIQDWEFAGASLGAPGRLSTVNGHLLVFGDGVDDYTNIKFLVRELNKRLNKNSALLDRHSSPHIQGPASAVTTNAEGNPQVNINEDSAFLPLDPDGPDYSYLTWDQPYQMATYQLDKVVDLLHLQTGIPIAAFGLAPNNQVSGISLDRQMFGALSKVRRLRREVERAIAVLGIEDVVWPADPFASYNENIDGEVKLVNAGISDPAQSAERLNIDAPTREPQRATAT